MRYFLFLATIISFMCYEMGMPAYGLTLAATDFTAGQKIPKDYTCDGENISPELTWSTVPVNTKSFVLTMTDPDTPGGVFYHWILYNIPSTLTTLSKNLQTLPAGARRGKNSWGKSQYNGPCPPPNSYHRYVFTLYALDSKLELPENEWEATPIFAAMQHRVLTSASLTVGYTR